MHAIEPETYLRWALFITSMLAAVLLTLTQSVPVQANAAYRSSQGTVATDARLAATPFFEEGEEYQESKEYGNAAAAYQKAIETDLYFAEAYSGLASVQRVQGNYDEAVANYVRAIRLNFRLPGAQKGLGETYAEMGKFDLAEKQLSILRKLQSAEAAQLEAFIKAHRGK